MTFIIGILTVLMVLNALLLILLVLIQLPKKDAGAGLAFGGGAADALFGAGSGNALTKITKYAAGIFFVFAIILGHLQSSLHHTNSSEFERKVQQQQESQQTPLAAPAQSEPTTSMPTAAATQANLLAVPLQTATNSPVQSK
ncbi:MAG: preprotein translocase subunit SecG [Verrucomicrobiota bacterium]|jgi:preprotein translocase subunit SecG